MNLIKILKLILNKIPFSIWIKNKKTIGIKINLLKTKKGGLRCLEKLFMPLKSHL